MASRFGAQIARALAIAVALLVPALSIPAEAKIIRWAHPAHMTARAVPARVLKLLAPAPDKDAAVVVDGSTGKILYSRNPDEIRYPASLTKMMTLYLLFEALEKGQVKLDTELNTSQHASEQEPSKLGLKPGQQIDVETAIKAITVLSANDVAVVIGESLGQSEAGFAEMMTEKAHQLGMVRTNFHNASGLPDPLQLTTASDMALLGRHVAYDFPQYYYYFSVPGFTFGGRTYGGHDALLSTFAGTDGIKTGYTRDSGFNLVTSAVRNNKHILGVVMGGASSFSRDHEMIRLLTAAFDYAAANPAEIADANVPWQGGKGPGFDPFKMAPAGGTDVLTAYLDAPKSSTAPVQVADAKPSRSYLEASVIPLPSAQLTAAGAKFVNGVLTNGRTQLAALKARVMKVSAPKQTAPAQPAQEKIAAAVPANLPAGKRWAVQIGAFASASLAQTQLAAYAQHTQGAVSGAQRLVVPLTSADGHIVYRARFGSFAENDARNICKQMTAQGETCFAAQIN